MTQDRLGTALDRPLSMQTPQNPAAYQLFVRYACFLVAAVGVYFNTLLKLQANQAEEFVTQISTLANEEDYERFAEKFAIRRTNPDFWQHSDLIHQAAMSADKLRAGIFDYNRLENR